MDYRILRLVCYMLKVLVALFYFGMRPPLETLRIAVSGYINTSSLILPNDMARGQAKSSTKTTRRQAQGETCFAHWVYVR